MAAISLHFNSGSGWEAHADFFETIGCLAIKRLSEVQNDRLTYPIG